MNIRGFQGPVKLFLLFVLAPWIAAVGLNLGILVANLQLDEPLKYRWWPEFTCQASIYLGSFIAVIFLHVVLIRYLKNQK